MGTAFIVVALVVMLKTGMSMIQSSEACRRFALATCGALQMTLGMVAAAGVAFFTWSGTTGFVFASDAPKLPSEEVTVEKATTLSAEPGTSVFIPPGRPDWIAEAKDLEPGASWQAVVAGPCETRTECERELPEKVKQAADDYINYYLGSPMAAKLLHYDGMELRRRLVPERNLYGETIRVSFGPMEQVHAKLEFDDAFRHELDDRWRQVKAVSRLSQVGLIGAVVLGLLSTAFGFFKANTATRGTRSTNLQMAAAATILVIVVAGVTAARYLYWL
jgi:hypothetical protein